MLDFSNDSFGQLVMSQPNYKNLTQPTNIAPKMGDKANMAILL